MQFARAIKICRAMRDQTQQDLATKAGLSHSYISLLERGKREPTLDAIRKIANALKIPTKSLLLLALDEKDSGNYDGNDIRELSEKLLELIASVDMKKKPDTDG